jgi:hypothetical protein
MRRTKIPYAWRHRIHRITNLKDTDGIEIDISGTLRTLHLHDGWYVTGEGRLYPCKDEQEALEIIRKLNQ